MALQKTIDEMRGLLDHITRDLEKAEKGNKAASQRVRTGTVQLEKIAKTYRKESIHEEKQGGMPRRVGKRPAGAATATRMARAPAARGAKGKSRAKAAARPRSLEIKRPTAKLPRKKR